MAAASREHTEDATMDRQATYIIFDINRDDAGG